MFLGPFSYPHRNINFTSIVLTLIIVGFLEQMEVKGESISVENETINIQSSSSAPPSAATSKEQSTLRKIEDPDNFLLHLGDVLTRIHNTFYQEYDHMIKKIQQSSEQASSSSIKTPDLKEMIPRLRKSVFSDCNILFSGVIPLETPIERSREWNTSRAFGGNVHIDLVPGLDSADSEVVSRATSHLVVGRPDTSKYRRAMKIKGIKIVRPKWFWNSAERWLRLPEEDFTPDFHTKRKSNETQRPQPTVQELGRAIFDAGSSRTFSKHTKLSTETASAELCNHLKDKGKLQVAAQTRPLYSRTFSVSSEELEKMAAEVNAELSSDETDSEEAAMEELGSFVQSHDKDDLESFDAYLGLEEFSRKRKRVDNEASSNSTSLDDGDTDNSADDDDDELARLLMM